MVTLGFGTRVCTHYSDSFKQKQNQKQKSKNQKTKKQTKRNMLPLFWVPWGVLALLEFFPPCAILIPSPPNQIGKVPNSCVLWRDDTFAHKSAKQGAGAMCMEHIRAYLLSCGAYPAGTAADTCHGNDHGAGA